ncbi:MAG: sulfurtransferase-like selenium metabolism protein YedF [Desulfitobacteriaceae bacterium]|nr:sulfurtransferase-like selenium metabolism protein YedF [Desulfitobacteriaceae bacterium]MDI6879246.1 sulfurtransferase-like selenium metabolism protein YedF [Desulfitobacteriaceae bacterium]MDI6913726.1 sulfurtransferase-like selenium metabolism protein YedF [Desulfitobacteriaceae bacterium]
MAGFVYYIASDKIGNQDPELGKTLMHNFMVKLLAAKEKPTHILFVERGVQLLLADSSAFEALKDLEEEGIVLLACQTCLDYYGIRDKIEVGEVSNMPTIIEKMHAAAKVISL